MTVYDWERARRRRTVRPSPLFLVFVAAAAIGAGGAWTLDGRPSRLGDFAVFVFVLAAWIVTVCLHEFAHAYSAYRAGDREVEAAGYLTLNPFKYTHPLLSILLPLVAIVAGGFALPGGAVYLHPHTFRSRGRLALASAAGPLVNLVIGAVLVVVAQSHLTDQVFITADDASWPGQLRFWSAVAFLGFLQLTAAVLNLLPIPGLDGWGIIEPYLSRETQEVGNKIKPWGLLGVIVLLYYSDTVRNWFFDIVGWLFERFGGTDSMWGIGSLFFKFWTKQPL